MKCWRGCIFIRLLYPIPRAAHLCGENGAKRGVLFSAQFDAGKGLRTFLEKLLRAPSYGAVGVAHKSAILGFVSWGLVIIGRWRRDG